MSQLSRKALMVHAGVMGYVLPRLATDAKIDLKPIFHGVTSANYVSMKPALALGIASATNGKLATDAKLDELNKVLLAFDSEEEESEEERKAREAKEAKDKAKDKARDARMGKDRGRGRDAMPEAFMKHMKEKMSEDEFKSMCDAMEDYEAEDESEEEKEKKAKDKAAKDKAARDEAEEEKKKADEDAEKAMDAAIKGERANQRAIREAEKFIRPWVGDISIACDSADGVFKSALDMLKVKTDGIHPSAYKAILEAQPKPGQRTSLHIPAALGMDSNMDSALKTAPDIARIGLGAI